MVNLTSQKISGVSFTWEELLEILRDELQEYGGLIGLLNAQQQSILNRRSESLMELNKSVQTQMEASQILLRKRQGFVDSVGGTYGKTD